MTNSSSHEARVGEPTLEEKVIAIFHESRKVLGSGNKKFPDFERENPHNKSVEVAVGELAVDQLIELVATGQSEALKDVASAWAEYQVARKLHDEAYSAFVESQNEALMDLLKDRRIKAIARPDAPRYAICPSDGAFTTSSDSNPKEVSGAVLGANVNTGELILGVDNPKNRERYWVVDVLSQSLSDAEARQLVDIRIEEPVTA